MDSVFLVDVSNLYYYINKFFPDRHLDYKKLFDKSKEFGSIQRAIAYGTQRHEEANNFITCIRAFGYEVQYKRHILDNEDNIVKKASWIGGITVDMVRFSERFHTIVLGSSDTDLLPAVQYVRGKGAKVICLASGINREMKNNVNYYFEIGESLLQVNNGTT